MNRRDLEDAIRFQADLARRYGRYWSAYEYTHQEINRLLDEWEEARNKGLTRALRLR